MRRLWFRMPQSHALHRRLAPRRGKEEPVSFEELRQRRAEKKAAAEAKAKAAVDHVVAMDKRPDDSRVAEEAAQRKRADAKAEQTCGSSLRRGPRRHSPRREHPSPAQEALRADQPAKPSTVQAALDQMVDDSQLLKEDIDRDP